ncbi:uncharacterized protein LOC127182589 [Labeo rohita]|uniref:uncharacterized protein LOC127182589 n=1 Tax=Labeo rohita TaxID=84645 RepID=UPI0021E2B4F7|nr:uncharacterized protein LOC127182589 [Labeo rohita]
MNYRCSNMENEISSDDVNSCLTQEYYKLLAKVEELLRKNPARSDDFTIDTISLRADGHFGKYKFINMCVPDSYLMALYICYIQYDCIASLFNSFEKLRAPMVFLRDGLYNEAKASWLFGGLDCPAFEVTNDISDNEKFVINALSEPKDHLHMFNDLVLPKDYSSPSIKQVSENSLSKFEHLGDVHGLGFSDPHPLLILVDTQQQLDKAPPLYIDDYNRTFKLQFLLMTRQSFLTHLIAGLNMFDRWVLYDDLKLSPCDDFNLKCADFTEDFVILFAGYVNITHDDQDRDVPFGVAEEGYQGTVPFNPSRGCNDYGKEHID